MWSGPAACTGNASSDLDSGTKGGGKEVWTEGNMEEKGVRTDRR